MVYGGSMRIGIVGLGVVGEANKVGFTSLGHHVTVHDVKIPYSDLGKVVNSDIVFICVPTPSNEKGECDTSIVESVIHELHERNHTGIIAIRSSTVPGFTESMISRYKNDKICFVPEFLRERCAVEDFINNHEVLSVGTNNQNVYYKVVGAHGHYPKQRVQLSPTEAEVMKYYLNLYGATRVVFANVFYEICKKLNANYSKVKDAYIKTGRHGDMYLDVSEDLRGYGGPCLPKDTRAIIGLMDRLNIDMDFFKTVDSDNKKLKTTVFEGMREENAKTD